MDHDLGVLRAAVREQEQRVDRLISEDRRRDVTPAIRALLWLRLRLHQVEARHF